MPGKRGWWPPWPAHQLTAAVWTDVAELLLSALCTECALKCADSCRSAVVGQVAVAALAVGTELQHGWILAFVRLLGLMPGPSTRGQRQAPYVGSASVRCSGASANSRARLVRCPNVRAKAAPTVGRQAAATENVHRTCDRGLEARRWGSP
jgi:hypothetical protein